MNIKNLILLLFLLQGSIIFCQEKFENNKLNLLNEIFYKTTKDNINSFMKEKGFKKEDVEQENEGDIKEIYVFSSKFDNVEIYYTKENKVFGVNCIYMGAPNNIFIEMELKNKGYNAKIEKQTWEEETISKNVWGKAGSKLKFVTYSDEKEKMGTVSYGYYKD